MANKPFIERKKQALMDLAEVFKKHDMKVWTSEWGAFTCGESYERGVWEIMDISGDDIDFQKLIEEAEKLK